MPKVTFSIQSVVCVTIKGEGEDGVPQVREDGGLVSRFLRFLIDKDIYPALRGGNSGGGSYCGFFTAEDAKQIEAWLLEQGAKRDQ